MILDTSALYSFLTKDMAIRRHVAGSLSFCIPVIVLGEHRFGLRDSREQTLLESKLDALVSDSTIQIVDEDTARTYALVRAELKAAGVYPRPRSSFRRCLCRTGLPIDRKTEHLVLHVEPGQSGDRHGSKHTVSQPLHLAQLLFVAKQAVHSPVAHPQGPALTVPEAQPVDAGLIAGQGPNSHRVA